MHVTQPGSRSISIVSDSGVKFFVPYRIFWNGHDRLAESVVLTSPPEEDEPVRIGRTGKKGKKAPPAPSGVYEVRAFFLFGEIRDRITDDADGIRLARTWSVQTPGSGHLSIDVEFDPTTDLSCMFPGLHTAHGLPPSPLSFLGEKTSYPSSLFLSLGKKGVILFSPSAVCRATPGSIGISRTDGEDEPDRLRVEMRFPGIEEPAGRIGRKPGDLQPADDTLIESPGSLERSHELCLAFSSREEIAVRGGVSVIHRVSSGPSSAASEPDAGALAEALQDVLKHHLYQVGGVAGLKELRGSPWLSVSAGLGCALALLRLFPGDARLEELALRLADFALRGQVPWGTFHESFHIPSGQWRGVRGREKDSLVSVGQSAWVAELLLALADELAQRGQPNEKYFLAGLRFVEFFLDSKVKLVVPGGLHDPSSSTVSGDAVPGIAGLEVFFPLALVLGRTGHDRYKKALDVLVRRFSSLPWNLFQPPASREDRGSDSAAALLAARLFVDMRALGYKPVEPTVSSAAAARARAADSARLFASLLVPWVRIHDEPAHDEPAHDEPAHEKSSVPRSGCLLDSFARQRLLCAGHETSLLLLRLRALNPGGAEQELLARLARDCLASARRVPIGTAFIQHTRWDAAGVVEGGSARRRKGEPAIPSAGGVNAPALLGPVDSRRVATEVLAGIRLAAEFPPGDR